MGPGEFLAEIDGAFAAGRYADVAGLVDRIDPSRFDAKQAATALKRIRKKRLYDELKTAARLLGGNAGRLQIAQAFLDENKIQEGLKVLHKMLPAAAHDPEYGPEVRGLIGRAYKQRFVNTGRRADLGRAITQYRQDWQANPALNRWHGINLAALLKRAAREGIAPPVSDDADGIARSILDEVDALDEPGVWDYGTAMEAAVALGDKGLALRWAKRYVQHPWADAFELGSTLRQMREVWQLEGTEMGDALLPVLEYELLQKDGAVLEIKSLGAGVVGFEAVYGPEGLVRLEWLDGLFARCRPIARVFDPETNEKWGTGFLVSGVDLCSEWGAAPVFVTNSHVVSGDPADQAPLHPGEAAAEFTRLEDRPKIVLGKLLFTSPRVDLDVSVFDVAAPDRAVPLVLAKYLPAVPDRDETQRIYVVGHASGDELSVSLYDNNLAHYDGRFVRYHSPTEGGMSGSPVFNRRWQTFALHHRTVAKEKLNEGVCFEAIKSATSNCLTSRN